MSVRRAVRVLLVDPDERLLLLSLQGGWWITVGGGIEAGESPHQAAVREVAEETGLVITVGQVGPQVWRGRRVFPWQGATYDQSETFHVVRCPAFEPHLRGLMRHEQAEVTGWRWWTAIEIAAYDGPDHIRPEDLGLLLPRVLAGPWQGPPVDLGTRRDA